MSIYIYTACVNGCFCDHWFCFIVNDFIYFLVLHIVTWVLVSCVNVHIKFEYICSCLKYYLSFLLDRFCCHHSQYNMLKNIDCD